MNFRSKFEAFSYVLLHLLEIRKNYADTALIDVAINEVKKLIGNHEQNPLILEKNLEFLFRSDILDEIDLNDFKQILEDIGKSDYQQTLYRKYENPLGRRFESELPIFLLLHPTRAMMDAVERVSQEIIKMISDPENVNHVQDLIKGFRERYLDISLGAFINPPSLQELIKILEENKASQLPEILFIHFSIAQSLMRDLPIRQAPHRPPVGKLKEIIPEIWRGDPTDFFRDGISLTSNEGNMYRSYISDEKIYQSELFTSERGRGRQGELDENARQNQLGLLLPEQTQFAEGLPYLNVSWVPDCKGQAANLNSQIVKDLIENEAVYVAGPSGMVGLLLGQMENVANLENEELKKLYLTAIVCYIVGGGFHSLHETIAPAQYALNLVPGYHVEVSKPNKLASPPNYHVFYKQLMAIDKDAEAALNIAWLNYLSFFNEIYGPSEIEEFAKKRIDFEGLYATSNYIPFVSKEELITAAIELEDSIKNAALEYRRKFDKNPETQSNVGVFFQNTQQEITHKINALVLKTTDQELETHLSLLKDFFTNKFADIEGNVVISSEESNNLFMNFLLNQLKLKPDLIYVLNALNPTTPFILNASIDYTELKTKSLSRRMLEFFKNMNTTIIKEEKTSQLTK